MTTKFKNPAIDDSVSPDDEGALSLDDVFPPDVPVRTVDLDAAMKQVPDDTKRKPVEQHEPPPPHNDWYDNPEKRARFLAALDAIDKFRADDRGPLRQSFLRERYPYAGSFSDIKTSAREVGEAYRQWFEGRFEPPATSTPPSPVKAPASGDEQIEGGKRQEGKEPPVWGVLNTITTLTGIPAGQIQRRINARFPASAYKEIPYGAMKSKTSLRPQCVRDRFDEVFGPHGIGWRIVPHPALGRVECVGVFEKVAVKDKSGKVTGEREREIYMVALEAHIFQYRVVMPDGALEWAETGPLSDCDANEDRGYAYRAAWSSLTKQFLRAFGGLNHMLYGEYTHIEAGREQRKGAS